MIADNPQTGHFYFGNNRTFLFWVDMRLASRLPLAACPCYSWGLSSGSVWLAPGDERVFGAIRKQQFRPADVDGYGTFARKQPTPCSFQIMTSLAII